MAKGNATTTSERTPLQMLATGVLLALVLLQGGFQSVSTCVVSTIAMAIVTCMVCMRRWSLRITLPVALLAALGCIEVVSAFANGISAGALVKSLEWFGLAGLMLLLSCEDEYGVSFSEDDGGIHLTCWAGVGLSVLGCLMFSQVLPLNGVVDSGRLQFTFQYANAAGIFFATIAVLCASSKDIRLRWLASLPILALLLTRSMGALALFAFAALLLVVIGLVRKSLLGISELFIQVLLAGIAFACSQVLSVLSLLWAVALCVLGWFAVKALNVGANPLLAERLSSPVLAGILAVIVVVASVAVMFVLMPERVLQAQQTFIERTIQMQDALQVLSGSFLLGIGPGKWGSLYPFVQSAQYQASSLHCGYLQIALDAGTLGLLVFAVFVAVGILRVAQARNAGLAIAASMIALHAIVDFDFEFSALVFLFGLLVNAADAAPQEQPELSLLHRLSSSIETPVQLQAVCCALCIVLCIGAIGVGAWKSSIVSAGWRGDYSSSQAVSGNDLLSNDDEACNAACAAIFQNPSLQDIEAFTQQHPRLNATQTMLLGRAYILLGDSEAASVVLLKALEEQPYNTALFEEVSNYLDPSLISESAMQRWRAAAERANKLASSGNASKLANQKTVAIP